MPKKSFLKSLKQIEIPKEAMIRIILIWLIFAHLTYWLYFVSEFLNSYTGRAFIRSIPLLGKLLGNI